VSSDPRLAHTTVDRLGESTVSELHQVMARGPSWLAVLEIELDCLQRLKGACSSSPVLAFSCKGGGTPRSIVLFMLLVQSLAHLSVSNTPEPESRQDTEASYDGGGKQTSSDVRKPLRPRNVVLSRRQIQAE
jgi:hypothetical protein